MISVLTIFEIKKKMYKDKMDVALIEAAIAFIQKKSLVEPVSREIVDLAAQLSFQHQLAEADALIYATARHRNVQLITRDNDFQGLQETLIL